MVKLVMLRTRVMTSFLVVIIPSCVIGGQHFTSWLDDIVKEKGVNEFETDYRWSSISSKPSEKDFSC